MGQQASSSANGGDGRLMAAAAAASAYDPTKFEQHMARLAASDQAVAAAIAAVLDAPPQQQQQQAGGNVPGWVPGCVQKLAAAVEQGHEMASFLVEALQRVAADGESAAEAEEAARGVLQGYRDLLAALAPASVDDLLATASVSAQRGDFRMLCLCDRLAAAKGSMLAVVGYANRFGDGRGVAHDPAAKELWMRHAAENGEGSAMFNLGLDQAQAGRHKVAVAWYTRGAKAGSAECQVNLGSCYENGRGVRKNMQLALRSYEAAAAQNHPVGLENAANCHNHGWGTRKDLAAGAAWLRRGAEAGVPVAQARLAHCYEAGEGVEQSWPEAVRWYKLAAEQGEAVSQFNLANSYIAGRGVEQDVGQAVLWYNRALRQGLREAAIALGRRGLPILDDDTMSGRSPEENYEYHLELAEAGDAEEMAHVAGLLLRGSGVEPNPRAALAFLDQAVEQGVPAALKTRGDVRAGFLDALDTHDGEAALADYAAAEAAGVDCTIRRVQIHLGGKGEVERSPEAALAALHDAFARSHVIREYKAMSDLQASISGHEEAGSREASDAAVAADRPFTMSRDDIRFCHYYFALIHDLGLGLPRDLDIANRHYAASMDTVSLAKVRSAELKLRAAAARAEAGEPEPFSISLDDEEPDAPEDIVKAYQALAENDTDGDVRIFLGGCFQRGFGVPADPARAKELYTEAARDSTVADVARRCLDALEKAAEGE